MLIIRCSAILLADFRRQTKRQRDGKWSPGDQAVRRTLTLRAMGVIRRTGGWPRMAERGPITALQACGDGICYRLLRKVIAREAAEQVMRRD
ncbi:hypothetical protein C5750_24970 [Phyllobacterium myrsinacearum]|uniref:Uncharacterized protein n=1 Tax=Phyllobacterium myrsinacearum TaxID=28101 RepID=A0A2S9JAF8_9HYPH|nr:hypothetical protein C5750_24970 [Phyllobacterium myrsinacearum]